MQLNSKTSNHNFYAFLWHAGFLAFAQNFMDVDTVIPAMIIEAGGGAIHIGVMTAIMLGGSSFTQIFFAPHVSNISFKKKYLLLGINIRVLSLFALGLILFFLQTDRSFLLLYLIFLFITLFSLSGAFTNISYTDILGKSIQSEKRKTFFSVKQVIAGVIFLISAFLAKRVLTFWEYPLNYAMMFLLGASVLLIASGGFWKIKETIPSSMKIKGYKDFAHILKKELVNNPKLVYFLGFINTQGIILSFLPFVMLYAKTTLQTESNDTGIFLIYKVAGVVSVSLLVFFLVKNIKYNLLLYTNAFLSMLLIIGALFIQDEYLIRFLFILGGIIFSLYSITMNGLLLEVSGSANRAIYTGFAGAGNILPAMFPIAGGWMLSQFGFITFFITYSVIVSSSLFFIYKIDCRK
ncbi:MAG: MFS transporter [Bacteroidales bacterium]